MNKFVAYDSDELQSFISKYKPAQYSKSFDEWATLNDVIINWGRNDIFLEFQNEKSKLAFIMKWC